MRSGVIEENPDLKKETVRSIKCGIRRIGLQEVITII